MSIEDDDADDSARVIPWIVAAMIVLALTFLVGSIVFWPAV